MNKLHTIIVALIVIILGGWLLFSDNKKEQIPPVDESVPIEEELVDKEETTIKEESSTMHETVEELEGETDPNIMTLEMKTWTWLKTTYNNDTEVTPKNVEAFTLNFNTDGTFSATTDCNSIGGNYSTEDNKISLGEMMSTQMYCEGSQEQEFSSMLREVQSSFFTSKGQLILELKFDTGSIIFE